jgi:hypothetical protein
MTTPEWVKRYEAAWRAPGTEALRDVFAPGAAGPPVREYRDLWVVRFGSDGLCVDFEEWPFFPGQSITAPRD